MPSENLALLVQAISHCSPLETKYLDARFARNQKPTLRARYSKNMSLIRVRNYFLPCSEIIWETYTIVKSVRHHPHPAECLKIMRIENSNWTL